MLCRALERECCRHAQALVHQAARWRRHVEQRSVGQLCAQQISTPPHRHWRSGLGSPVSPGTCLPQLPGAMCISLHAPSRSMHPPAPVAAAAQAAAPAAPRPPTTQSVAITPWQVLSSSGPCCSMAAEPCSVMASCSLGSSSSRAAWCWSQRLHCHQRSRAHAQQHGASHQQHWHMACLPPAALKLCRWPQLLRNH